VISYDAPPTARIYVHRAGRTARAGREGDMWSLVVDKEARWFWKSVIGGIRRSGKVERVRIPEIEEGLKTVYESIVEV